MGRTLAVADLHGMYGLWEQVRKSLATDDTLYILGDIADRGTKGWQMMKEALADPRVIYIRGNHDQMLLDCWFSEWHDNYIWFCNGGYETFDSILNDERHEIFLTQLAKSKLYHCYVNKEGQRIHLSHAGFTLMENDEIPNKEDLLWDRDHIFDHCDWWPEQNPTDYVVHGHSWCASKACFGLVDIKLNDTYTVGKYCHGHKICIDGRSFVTGQVAVLDLDTFEEEVFCIE